MKGLKAFHVWVALSLGLIAAAYVVEGPAEGTLWYLVFGSIAGAIVLWVVVPLIARSPR